MKDRIRTIALSLSLLLVMLSGCGQASGPDPAPSSHSEMPAPAVYSEPVEGPSHEAQSERSMAQLESQRPIVSSGADAEKNGTTTAAASSESVEYTNIVKGDGIPVFSGDAYVVINDNQPYFQQHELSTQEFESYSDLDALGRCGTAFANVSPDSMPTEERGSIGQIKPSGWHTVRYDCVDGKYLYNRCHLIGYQLTAENANVKNLITGTRYLNMEGMLPFENMVADYVKETGNHVAYRVTPVFQDEDLLASGVLMEGYSIEDKGEGICFCVFAYNVQPGVMIDHKTGDSQRSEGDGQESGIAMSTSSATAPTLPVATPTPTVSTLAPVTETPPSAEPTQAAQQEESAPVSMVTYIINTNTGKFHYLSCSSVRQMNEENKRVFNGTADQLVQQGYSPCQRCRP